MSRATELLEADGLYGAARATDQSGQRGWDFRPATFDARRVKTGAFILRTLAQAIACAAPVVLMWVVL
jgi:hypothetical protein